MHPWERVRHHHSVSDFVRLCVSTTPGRHSIHSFTATGALLSCHGVKGRHPFRTSFVSRPRMANQPGCLADDGDLKKSTNPTTPPLHPIFPFRTFVNSSQHRLTRAFALDENIEFPEFPDAGQPVV